MELRRRTPASATETSRPKERCILLALSVARTPCTAKPGCSFTLQIARELLAYEHATSNCQLADIDHRVLKVLSLVETEWANQLKVRDLATRVELSPSRLSHLFKRELGVSVGQFVQSVRLARTIAALADSEERISQVCYESGMRSLSSFDRAIRRTVGCSPKELRRIQARMNYVSAHELSEIAGLDKK
jgi:AraC-like DNA-binding protein